MIINRQTRVNIFTLLLFITFSLTNVFGQTVPDRPNPPRLVNDYTKTLTQQEISSLEQKLVRFNDTTSNQITVVLVNSLNGLTPSMFAYEVGAKWSVGQKKFDNGIVVLIKPKLSSSDKGEVYIAVGYGLEPAIPDAITKRIINNEMIPYLKNGDYYEAINKATNVLMNLASGEISADGYKKRTGTPAIFSLIPFLIIIIVVIAIRKSGGKSQGIGRSNTSLWTALWLGSMMSGRGSSSGSWGNFSGGSSGFGGGGGFGGFGGGSFGGGGAGGSW